MATLTFKGGIHPYDGKELTKDKPIRNVLPKGDLVYPMQQHIGAPAKPVVKKGDRVLAGQKIAEAGAFVSAPVYATVSGTVKAIEPRRVVTGEKVMSIVVENDELYEETEAWEPLDEKKASREEIIDRIKEAGIVGMGGAGFPTFIKLSPKEPDKIDYVIVNCAECEPYLTSDYRRMMEEPQKLIDGLKVSLSLFPKAQGILAVEDNKKDCIALLRKLTKDEGRISVKALKTKYPQGAEKTLIKRVMGRKVPSGGLPADVGVIVDNISTVKAISDAIQKGMPLIERVTTITGEKIKNPGNFIIKIGTSVKELIDYCGGFTDDDVLVKMGGPMMGFPLNTLDVPMMKGSNGIIAIDTDETKEQPCIKCGRCVDVCPMELSPLYFVKYAKEENWQGMKDMNVMDCVECRCCQYICSSKIPIINSIKAGKNAVRGMK